MTPPKKMQLNDPKCMMIWDAETNTTKNRTFDYISVDHLKEWLDDKRTDAPRYMEQAMCNMVLDELSKFLEDES